MWSHVHVTKLGSRSYRQIWKTGEVTHTCDKPSQVIFILNDIFVAMTTIALLVVVKSERPQVSIPRKCKCKCPTATMWFLRTLNLEGSRASPNTSGPQHWSGSVTWKHQLESHWGGNLCVQAEMESCEGHIQYTPAALASTDLCFTFHSLNNWLIYINRDRNFSPNSNNREQ